MIDANVPTDTDTRLALNRTADGRVFLPLAKELHSALWAGGGSSGNEIFMTLVKLFLYKIFDERETMPEDEYSFQIRRVEGKEESPEALVKRLTSLYEAASRSMLGFDRPSKAPFDQESVPFDKVAHAVRRLQGVSLTDNQSRDDVLGVFFEQIVAKGFTQTKGQFFIPKKLVEFILELADVSGQAKGSLTKPGHKMPLVIDTSCDIDPRKVDTEEVRQALDAIAVLQHQLTDANTNLSNLL